MDLTTLIDQPPWEWPEDIADHLLKTLPDETADESRRMLAAEMAGEVSVINDELAAALLSLAKNPGEPALLRQRALYSLGPGLEYADIEGFEDPDGVAISEKTFLEIQRGLLALFKDAGLPEDLRRAALEASVHAPQDWHNDAIRHAFSSDDESWRLSAVFCMGFVPGFNDQILEALRSDDEDIHYEAVLAAGNWELDGAWSHIAGLIRTEGTDKHLLMAAIEAAAAIRPHEAGLVLTPLLDSNDEDIVEAAQEAMSMAEEYAAEEEDEDEDEDEDEEPSK